MATNKNQHYVPRCHLRPFTLDAANLAINVFNLDRKKLITKAPVKNQCSGDYFYGTDEKLEKAIQVLESSYSETLRALVDKSNSLPRDNAEVLKFFWMFQHLRTEAAAIRAVQMFEAARELAALPPEEFVMGIKDAVQIACQTFAEAMYEIDDLKFCIVKNKTKTPFLTSDNPAVITNKWHLDRDRLRVNSFGLGSAGAIVILPLTPKLLFLGYDGDVYSVPHEKGIVEIRNDRDILAFNRHQFLNCAANVYVDSSVQEDMLIKHYSEIEQLRPRERYVIHYAEFDKSEGGHTRYVVVPTDKRDMTKDALMHSQVIHPHPGIWPSKIRIREKGAVYTNGTGIGYVRSSRTTDTSTNDFQRERP